MGECQKIQFLTVRPTEHSAVAQDQAIQSGGSGSCAVRMGHVDYALSGFSSLRTDHHKLPLRIIRFRRKNRTGFKPLSYGEVLERTGSARIGTTTRKRQLGFAGALIVKVIQGSQSELCLGGIRYKDPSEEVDQRRLGRTAFRKTWRPSGWSHAKAKDGSGPHSELLTKMDGIGRLLRKTWECGAGGKGREEERRGNEVQETSEELGT